MPSDAEEDGQWIGEAYLLIKMDLAQLSLGEDSLHPHINRVIVGAGNLKKMTHPNLQLFPPSRQSRLEERRLVSWTSMVLWIHSTCFYNWYPCKRWPRRLQWRNGDRWGLSWTLVASGKWQQVTFERTPIYSPCKTTLKMWYRMCFCDRIHGVMNLAPFSTLIQDGRRKTPWSNIYVASVICMLGGQGW